MKTDGKFLKESHTPLMADIKKLGSVKSYKKNEIKSYYKFPSLGGESGRRYEKKYNIRYNYLADLHVLFSECPVSEI